MLPFLKTKHVAGLIIEKRKPDASQEAARPEEHENDAALHAAADDLADAIHTKDTKAIAAALRAAVEILNSAEPMAEESTEE